MSYRKILCSSVGQVFFFVVVWKTPALLTKVFKYISFTSFHTVSFMERHNNEGFNSDTIKEMEGVTKSSFCQTTAWLLVKRESSLMTIHTCSGLRTDHDSHTSLFLFLPMMSTLRITQRIQKDFPPSSWLRLLRVTFESVSTFCCLT